MVKKSRKALKSYRKEITAAKKRDLSERVAASVRRQKAERIRYPPRSAFREPPDWDNPLVLDGQTMQELGDIYPIVGDFAMDNPMLAPRKSIPKRKEPEASEVRVLSRIARPRIDLSLSRKRKNRETEVDKRLRLNSYDVRQTRDEYVKKRLREQVDLNTAVRNKMLKQKYISDNKEYLKKHPLSDYDLSAADMEAIRDSLNEGAKRAARGDYVTADEYYAHRDMQEALDEEERAQEAILQAAAQALPQNRKRSRDEDPPIEDFVGVPTFAAPPLTENQKAAIRVADMKRIARENVAAARALEQDARDHAWEDSGGADVDAFIANFVEPVRHDYSRQRAAAKELMERKKAEKAEQERVKSYEEKQIALKMKRRREFKERVDKLFASYFDDEGNEIAFQYLPKATQDRILPGHAELRKYLRDSNFVKGW